jgi:hypothetical protein
VARGKGILFVVHYRIGGQPTAATTLAKSHQEKSKKRCHLPKSWRDGKNPDRRPVRLRGIEPAKEVE